MSGRDIQYETRKDCYNGLQAQLDAVKEQCPNFQEPENPNVKYLLSPLFVLYTLGLIFELVCIFGGIPLNLGLFAEFFKPLATSFFSSTALSWLVQAWQPFAVLSAQIGLAAIVAPFVKDYLYKIPYLGTVFKAIGQVFNFHEKITSRLLSWIVGTLVYGALMALALFFAPPFVPVVLSLYIRMCAEVVRRPSPAQVAPTDLARGEDTTVLSSLPEWSDAPASTPTPDNHPAPPAPIADAKLVASHVSAEAQPRRPESTGVDFLLDKALASDEPLKSSEFKSLQNILADDKQQSIQIKGEDISRRGVLEDLMSLAGNKLLNGSEKNKKALVRSLFVSASGDIQVAMAKFVKSVYDPLATLSLSVSATSIRTAESSPQKSYPHARKANLVVLAGIVCSCEFSERPYAGAEEVWQKILKPDPVKTDAKVTSPERRSAPATSSSQGDTLRILVTPPPADAGRPVPDQKVFGPTTTNDSKSTTADNGMAVHRAGDFLAVTPIQDDSTVSPAKVKGRGDVRLWVSPNLPVGSIPSSQIATPGRPATPPGIPVGLASTTQTPVQAGMFSTDASPEPMAGMFSTETSPAPIAGAKSTSPSPAGLPSVPVGTTFNTGGKIPERGKWLQSPTPAPALN